MIDTFTTPSFVFTVCAAPLLASPAGITTTTIPAWTLMQNRGLKDQAAWHGELRDFIFVTYKNKDVEVSGWIYKGYVDQYQSEFQPGVMSLPTLKDATEPNQHIIVRDDIDYNLCGEMCIARIAGLELEYILNLHQQKPQGWFERHFLFNAGRGTTQENLIDIFSKLEAYAIPLEDKISDPVIGRPIFSPARIAPLLLKGSIIVSCMIESVEGRLRPLGMPHWVVVENAIPDGIGDGWVEIYNPFSNQIQRYAWETFAASVQSPYGIYINI